MRTTPDDRLAYSVDELAEASGFSRQKLYADIAVGRIPARRLDKRIVVLADDARAWLAGLPSAATCD